MNSSNTSILGSAQSNGSKSAQKRRRYFANKRARLDALNSARRSENKPQFSLRTMPKIEPPKRRVVSTASVVAVQITAPAPSPAIPIIPNVISVNKTDSLEKVSVARRKAKAPAKAKVAKAKKAPAKPAKKAPAKKTIKKVKVKAAKKAPAKKAPAKAKAKVAKAPAKPKKVNKKAK